MSLKRLKVIFQKTLEETSTMTPVECGVCVYFLLDELEKEAAREERVAERLRQKAKKS